jgi:intracellular sulfur oxidation DsrE/DsrF family protein
MRLTKTFLPCIRNTISLLLLLTVVGCASMPSSGKQGVVIQVSDDSPVTWNQALNVAQNIPDMVGKDNVTVEIVAFGKGIGMLKFDSEVGQRLATAKNDGVAIRACGVTMRKSKLTEKDLYPDAGISVVPAGVVEIMTKHNEGWFVIRP